jgi:hypothetical protein
LCHVLDVCENLFSGIFTTWRASTVVGEVAMAVKVHVAYGPQPSQLSPKITCYGCYYTNSYFFVVFFLSTSFVTLCNIVWDAAWY